ncbi:MAG: hypothetical protein JRD04_12740 [Deltaproteobacteria bacterium]|nr:hypothetical protein [Deltaproteobacteria bacterium]
MPSWLVAIGGLLVKLFASIFTDAMKTPAEKTNVDIKEGKAPVPDIDYSGMYGIDARVQHRNEDDEGASIH